MSLRRAVLALTLVAALLGAGCIGAPTAPGTSGPGDPPVSDEAAKGQALAAEEAHLESVLSGADCLDSWGATSTVATEEATVVERSADHLRVEVRHPFWYTAGPGSEDGANGTTEIATIVHADGATEATYRVTENGTERLSGDELSPC